LSTPATALAYPRRARVVKRTLPRQHERLLVTILMGKALNTKLEVFAILEDRPKNEVMLEALETLLNGQDHWGMAEFSRRLPSDQKKKIVFILTADIEQRLVRYVNEANCSKTAVLNAAIMLYLEKRGIDPLSDPMPYLRRALAAKHDCIDSW